MKGRLVGFGDEVSCTTMRCYARESHVTANEPLDFLFGALYLELYYELTTNRKYFMRRKIDSFSMRLTGMRVEVPPLSSTNTAISSFALCVYIRGYTTIATTFPASVKVPLTGPAWAPDVTT